MLCLKCHYYPKSSSHNRTIHFVKFCYRFYPILLTWSHLKIDPFDLAQVKKLRLFARLWTYAIHRHYQMWWKMPSSHVFKLSFYVYVIWVSFCIFADTTRFVCKTTRKKWIKNSKVKRRNDCNVTRIKIKRKIIVGFLSLAVFLSYVNEWLTLWRAQIAANNIVKKQKTNRAQQILEWLADDGLHLDITNFGNHLKCFEWSKRALLMVLPTNKPTKACKFDLLLIFGRTLFLSYFFKTFFSLLFEPSRSHVNFILICHLIWKQLWPLAGNSSK